MMRLTGRMDMTVNLGFELGGGRAAILNCTVALGLG
jgi:hypothetical protein